jgi:hypothetical protein
MADAYKKSRRAFLKLCLQPIRIIRIPSVFPYEFFVCFSHRDGLGHELNWRDDAGDAMAIDFSEECSHLKRPLPPRRSNREARRV